MNEGQKAAAKEKIEQYAERVTESGCWIWTRSLRNNLYGHFHLTGLGLVSAHRAAYEIYVGDIPAGANVCHRCDVPMCCNPEHLYVGTQKENLSDMWRKSRGGVNKVTPDVVRQMRSAFASGAQRKELREQFGLSAAQTSKIVAGRSWAWV